MLRGVNLQYALVVIRIEDFIGNKAGGVWGPQALKNPLKLPIFDKV
jgi:hypothetical protein